MISVVIPTIAGREGVFEQTVQAFEDTAEETLQFIVPRDHATCGEAWNAGAELATGEYLMLAADDMIPHQGWDLAAIFAAEGDVYPAPWLLNTDGTTECCGTLGSGLLLNEKARDGLPVCNSPVPFMATDWWAEIGPSIPAHCYSDDYLAYRARLVGLEVRVVKAYKFTHLNGQPGHRAVIDRAMADRQLYAETVSQL